MYPVIVLLLLLSLCSPSFAEKIYVVEREREALSVIEDGKIKGEIAGLGNLNHATVKFNGDFAYVVGRDGFLSKIDTKADRLIKRINVGHSSIGFTFCKGIIAVANYSPKDVVILDEALNILKKIETGSRNVGIKCHDNLLIFSLMDRDEIWIHDCDRGVENVKVFKTKGEMPFDALLHGGVYVAGFFKGGVGIVDLVGSKYTEKVIKAGGEITFKIPHFGTWGVVGKRAFIPAVGERRLHIIGMKDFAHQGSVDLIGIPVFASVSPDGNQIAVNYSGDKEDFISIIDVENNRVLKDIEIGKRIMHIRFSNNSKRLYASSYFENKVKVLDTDNWKVTGAVDVPTPSGIFIMR